MSNRGQSCAKPGEALSRCHGNLITPVVLREETDAQFPRGRRNTLERIGEQRPLQGQGQRKADSVNALRRLSSAIVLHGITILDYGISIVASCLIYNPYFNYQTIRKKITHVVLVLSFLPCQGSVLGPYYS